MKILCFGDSNTYGYDPRSYLGGQYPAKNRWVDLLAAKLGCNAVNAGENGRQIPVRSGDLERFARMMDNQRPVDTLLIMLGSNDLLNGYSAEAVERRMEYFLSQNGPDCGEIILIGPPPMRAGEWVDAPALISASQEMNRRYRGLAHRCGIRFADSSEWNIELAFDGVHLTEDGHKQFAEKLYSFMREK